MGFAILLATALGTSNGKPRGHRRLGGGFPFEAFCPPPSFCRESRCSPSVWAPAMVVLLVAPFAPQPMERFVKQRPFQGICQNTWAFKKANALGEAVSFRSFQQDRHPKPSGHLPWEGATSLCLGNQKDSNVWAPHLRRPQKYSDVYLNLTNHH